MANNETSGGLEPSGASGAHPSTGSGRTGNDAPFGPNEGEGRAARDTHQPERKCILSGEHDARDNLIRLAISPDGLVLPDVRAKAPGRGAWIGVDRATLAQAQAKGRLKGALARAFKGRPLTIPDDLGARVEAELRRAMLDRLGLEARGGTLTTGSDRIEEAARRGRVHLLLHAADAGADGSRRLDQALRVGRDAEGSGLRGVALSLPRTILGVALGRENVVHIALTDRAAARRVEHALARWRGFIGPDGEVEPRDPSREPSGSAAVTKKGGSAADDAGDLSSR